MTSGNSIPKGERSSSTTPESLLQPEFHAVAMMRRDSTPLRELDSFECPPELIVHAQSFPSNEARDGTFTSRSIPGESFRNENDSLGVGVESPEKEANVPWAINCSWSSQTPTLCPVGMYYLVSNNSAKVSTAELPQVLARLQAVFQAASCQCDYRQNRVTCRTLEETVFAVSLWLSMEDETVLIEVDRTAGDSIIFHGRYVPLVMQAICGTCPTTKVPRDQYYTPENSNRPVDTVQTLLLRSATLPSALMKDDAAIHFDNALDIVGDTLASNHYDVSGLGLQSLILMTDPSKTFVNAAVTVSRIILTGSSGNGVSHSHSHRNSKIQQHILFLALTGRFWNSHRNTTSDEGMDDPQMAEQHAYRALNALANAVNLASAEDLFSFFQTAEQLFGDHSLVDRLLALVQDAQNSPHSAYLAARILAALAHHSIERDRINLNTIQHAQIVGACSHAALAQASHRLLTELAAVGRA